ncbi:hypothetical protein QVD17_27446 [Tagetes erecta]|uniref:NAB domain-containing protein n=1 Tax=Tagetes erecta TaxID=13708 RepID=A0AAD8K933_TARER|nr:hypothetical protein QVD17_27446 [Tagetes erecta]
MACVLTSESRRLYSWWWDSHIIPNNSKWLQENLADMDTKVKSMIKLIEEDADSFARRAEMYYKKRPDLMKLVEEFYRTYRALAERYDYATGELRHAQKALQAAFPDQEPFALLDDSSSLVDPSAQKNEPFSLELFLEGKLQYTNEKDGMDKRALGAESDVQDMMNTLAGLKSANDVDLLQCGICQEKISVLEKKIVIAEDEAKMFSEQAVKAEMEVEQLKIALLKLTEDKEALQVSYAQCLEKSYKLELDLSSAQSDHQRLTIEIVNSTKKLKRAEEICVCLEMSNQSLKMEVRDLSKKIMLKDQELSAKHDESKSTKVEFVGLKETQEVALQMGQCTDVQKEIFKLKEEITTSQQELTGLNPESFGSSVKYNLVVERSMVASRLESVQKRLQSLENQFMQFEKEKEQESCMMMNQKRLDDIENHIQEFHKLKKEEVQEELDKAVIAQFENLMLHEFVKEVEEENYFLSVENRKHIEASKLADKLISELETEILEQQVEEELLLVDVEDLRLGIHQVFSSLESGSNSAKISVEEIVGKIKDLKKCLSKEEGDKHRLLIENIVISALIQESESHKEDLMNKYGTMENDFFKVKKNNLELIKVNKNLTLELKERENELELWSAKFVFDLQISNTRDIFFESKVHELAEVCETLEAETASKDREIEEMKQKVSVMEREIDGLKAQLLAYTPVIDSLKASIASLEHNVANVNEPDNQKPEVHHHDNQIEPNGISDLLAFEMRIAAVEKVIVDDVNTVRRRKSSGINIKPKVAKPESSEWKCNEDQKRKKEEKVRGKRYLTLDNLNITKAKPELSEIRDIPLDQGSSRSRRGYIRSDGMLIEQLQISHRTYETENKSTKLSYEPQIEDLSVYKLQVLNQESTKEKFLQGNARDLETTMKRGKKASGAASKTMKQQLEEEEAEDEVWKRSQRMKWVQLDDGKKTKRGKTVILRDFIIQRGRTNRRRRLCGCFAPSPRLH